ncbi:MAG: aminopeptidase [Pseudomonadota bacterium]|nr:aminopeptidase [Pseudomonadota bacterium]
MVRIALLVGVALTLGACSRLLYYVDMAEGHIDLMSARQPIDQLLADPATDPQLKQRLNQVLVARRWAVTQLQLPDNGSYTAYADLGRNYVVWNVFATPELSLEPREHCFLFAGCLAYQGFYAEEDAEEQAADLGERGDDVYVGGVAAYSTLGWFDDPVLNTMMQWSDAALIGTVFHELAHQQLYVKNDTRFNESYASFVEQQGLSDFLREHPQTRQADSSAWGRRTQFVRLILASRQRLEDLYTSPLTDAEKRQRKAGEFARLQAEYTRLRDEAWGGDTSYDEWFSKAPLNNARLLPFGLYDEDVPAFAALFEQSGRDWTRFHAAAKALALLDEDERRARLDSLIRRSRPE